MTRLPPQITFALILFGAAISRTLHYLPQKPPNPKKEVKWFAIAGAGQLVAAGLLTALAVLQATFLPHPLGQCKNLSQLGETSYLDAIAKATTSHNEKPKSRGSVCHKMAGSWRFQIAMM